MQAGVIVGQRQILHPNVVPEDLIDQCQNVLQGKSRALIRRELQRTVSDVSCIFFAHFVDRIWMSTAPSTICCSATMTAKKKLKMIPTWRVGLTLTFLTTVTS